MKMQHVWVVEMLGDNGKWYPTCDSATTKQDCKEYLFTWQNANSSDKFRVAKYVREEDTWV